MLRRRGGERTDVNEFADEPPRDADKRIRQLHEHWHGLHPAGGGLPGRQHFDPMAVPRLLPFIWLADVQHNPLRFRYRLLGSEYLHIFGRDYTGRWIDELHPDFSGSPAHAQYVSAAERGIVGYRRGHTLTAPILPKDYRWIERVILPLARDGKAVDMLLALSVFHKTVRPAGLA
jgi:hypothetical protein